MTFTMRAVLILFLIVVLLILLLTIRLLLILKPKKEAYTASFRVVIDGVSFEGDNLKMNIKPNQQFKAAATNFRDGRGNPATPQTGSGVAESTNPAAFSVEKDPDNEFGIICKGNPEALGGDSDIGIARLTIDGDPDPNVESKIVLEIAVNITPRAAVVADFTAGPVENQPGVD